MSFIIRLLTTKLTLLTTKTCWAYWYSKPRTALIARLWHLTWNSTTTYCSSTSRPTQTKNKSCRCFIWIAPKTVPNSCATCLRFQKCPSSLWSEATNIWSTSARLKPPWKIFRSLSMTNSRPRARRMARLLSCRITWLTMERWSNHCPCPTSANTVPMSTDTAYLGTSCTAKQIRCCLTCPSTTNKMRSTEPT